MKTLLALLRALARILEEAANAGLVREVAIYLRRRRLQAAEQALEQRNERLARALVEGDTGSIDALLVELDRELLDAGVLPQAEPGGDRGQVGDTPTVDR